MDIFGAIILPTTHPNLHTLPHLLPYLLPSELVLLIPLYREDAEALGSGKIPSQTPGRLTADPVILVPAPCCLSMCYEDNVQGTGADFWHVMGWLLLSHGAKFWVTPESRTGSIVTRRQIPISNNSNVRGRGDPRGHLVHLLLRKPWSREGK